MSKHIIVCSKCNSDYVSEQADGCPYCALSEWHDQYLVAGKCETGAACSEAKAALRAVLPLDYSEHDIKCHAGDAFCPSDDESGAVCDKCEHNHCKCEKCERLRVA
jgi:hypothetical protein